MELPEKEAHIWYFNLDQASKKLVYVETLLSNDEIEKANKFKFEKDCQISMLARALLRLISSIYLDLESSEISFKYTEYGKPYYDFPTSMRFNVSHSGCGIALAFVRKGEIGVDIERINNDFDVLSISENFFSAAEINALQRLPKNEQVSGFYRCWTRKESFIKAKGSGLSFPLHSFTVSLRDKDAALLKTEWNPSEKENWNLFSFVPEKNYIGALTVDNSIRKTIHFDINDLNIKKRKVDC